MRVKVGKAVAAVVMAAAATVAAPMTASADNAVVAGTCHNGWFAFSVTATGGDIPAGSTWQSQWIAATNLNPQYGIDSLPGGVITSTPQNTHFVSLTNPNPIPAGTTVVLVPGGYPLTTKSPLRLILDGYGGRVDRSFPTDDDGDTSC
jgi:hypothetical protein